MRVSSTRSFVVSHPPAVAGLPRTPPPQGALPAASLLQKTRKPFAASFVSCVVRIRASSFRGTYDEQGASRVCAAGEAGFSPPDPQGPRTETGDPAQGRRHGAHRGAQRLVRWPAPVYDRLDARPQAGPGPSRPWLPSRCRRICVA